jgi:3-phenylpropionate/trans-cinnamate dioxygenase ferredoxin component
MPFVKIASVGEILPGTSRQVAIQGRTLGVFNVNGSYFAIDDSCTHRGAPLSEGDCQENEVVCPWHGARFSLETGAHLSPPAARGVVSYKVQVVGDEVQVELP